MMDVRFCEFTHTVSQIIMSYCKNFFQICLNSNMYVRVCTVDNRTAAFCVANLSKHSQRTSATKIVSISGFFVLLYSTHDILSPFCWQPVASSVGQK